VRGYLGIEVVEDSLETMKRRTKFVRRVLFKGLIGAPLLYWPCGPLQSTVA